MFTALGVSDLSLGGCCCADVDGWVSLGRVLMGGCG